MANFRTEKDSLGTVQVVREALYGAQTQRAIDNFPVSGVVMPRAFVIALLTVKQVAAQVNAELSQLPSPIADSIVKAVSLLMNDDDLMSHFPVDVFQTGSGTSSNMNANEVIANVATRIYQESGAQGVVDPNDHVNCGQSSNDVIPTTIHISSAISVDESLLPALEYLRDTILEKSESVKGHIKTGRTHLMDAMPIRLSQSLNAWADQISMNIDRVRAVQPQLQSLALGGTAVGTGVNAHPEFAKHFNVVLSQQTGLSFTPAENFFTHIGSQDIAVAVSGQLKTCAVSMMKIANDLRWMNSGPLAGLGEISLEPLQPGSSIMPGKVNPVIPEAAAMVAAKVIGNDSTINIAGQSGNFELNVMLPLIAHTLIESIELLSSSAVLLANKAVASFRVNDATLKDTLSRNPILITALNPIIGYAKSAEIAKKAYKEGRAIVEVANEETDLSLEELKALLDPTNLTG